MRDILKIGPTEKLLRRIRLRKGVVLFALIDPGKSEQDVDRLVDKCLKAGFDAFLVGGSTLVDQYSLDTVISKIRQRSRRPVVLFPGNITGLSPKADAVLFMSMLNSDDLYYVIGAQLQGSLLVWKYGLEAIPTAYIVVGEGGSAGHLGRARGIPFRKPELLAMYVLTARMMGMRFVYLEAGSGVSEHVPTNLVKCARRVFDGFLIVGGGIRDPTAASRIVEAGADAIVLGTIVEEGEVKELKEIVRVAREARGPS